MKTWDSEDDPRRGQGTAGRATCRILALQGLAMFAVLSAGCATTSSQRTGDTLREVPVHDGPSAMISEEGVDQERAVQGQEATGNGNWWHVFNKRVLTPITRGTLQVLKARSTLNLSCLGSDGGNRNDDRCEWHAPFCTKFKDVRTATS